MRLRHLPLTLRATALAAVAALAAGGASAAAAPAGGRCHRDRGSMR